MAILLESVSCEKREVNETYTATGVQDLHSIELSLLRNTVRLRADSSSTVGAVAVTICSGTVACKVSEMLGTC